MFATREEGNPFKLITHIALQKSNAMSRSKETHPLTTETGCTGVQEWDVLITITVLLRSGMMGNYHVPFWRAVGRVTSSLTLILEQQIKEAGGQSDSYKTRTWSECKSTSGSSL